MASTHSSAHSSTTISQLIDQIINTQDAPDVDLDKLIANIDSFLARCKPNQGKSSTVDWPSSASDAAEISEGISENVNKLAKEISEYSGKEHSTAISVLQAAGNVHWAGLGLLMVAAVLKRLDTIQKIKKECLDLLNSMNDLAKVVRKLKEIPRAKDEMLTQINESISLIVQGAIQCCSHKKAKRIKRFLHASKDRDDLVALRSKVDEMYTRLNINIGVQSLFILENSRICHQPLIHSVEYAVGIGQQIDEVVKRLQWENDAPSVAVLVHGIGGSGKSTLTDAVYAFSRDKLKGWKYSKITLIENMEENPNVKKLQSSILWDLTGKKEKVTDLESGRQRLKEIMEKESVFLYIDNALYRDPLQQLLPRQITNPKKLRLLLTARKRNISDVMEDCRIQCESYPIEPLPLEAAIQILCRKIDPKRDTKSLSEERPEIKVIAEGCRICPLLLEVVGAFLWKMRNDEAYKRVLKWMEKGEPFSGDREDRFDEPRIMFAYYQLESSAKHAFLDICSFFYGRHWDWDEVARIVGEVEMQCLEEGALIKKKKEKTQEGRIITEISIHDLLLNVGRWKSEGNRFRTLKESIIAIEDVKLRPQIEGVWLKESEEEFSGPIHVPAEVLDAMSGSLRVFALGKWTLVKGKCSKSFDELRFLQADNGVSNLPMDISKLSRLTYIKCSLKGNIKLSELKDLSALKVVDVSNPPDSWNSSEISELRYSNKLMELSESLGKLMLLEELDLNGCEGLKQLPVGFGKLKNLAVLNLHSCSNLQKLPKDFVNLSSLRYLCLENCKSLQELPSNIEKLTSLQYLNLSYCSELVRLPERLGNLSCLTEIYFSSCWKLSSLPQSLGGLISLLMSNMSFDKCSSLTELPEETSWLSGMKSISFADCSKLQKIPTQFSKLTSLEELILAGCESIEELCNDSDGLEQLRELDMRLCRRLCTLPQGFGKLKSLQILNLSECDKLEELCGDFHCLGALKELLLFGCRSLTKLPNSFGKLTSLQFLHLSNCDKLEELCGDFHCLGALKQLDLSGCRSLTKLPHSFGKLRSLQFLNLSRCDKLEELCGDFHCLGALKQLSLSGCRSLTKLPNSFGKLTNVQILDLSECDKLEELCGDFHFLGALKELDLSGCRSLTKLPHSFGQLCSLEKANLSGCSNLAKLSDNFHTLPSLIRLNLSNCKRLGAEWMDCVVDTQSLWSVDISGSDGMTERWMEMQSKREECHLAVVTESSSFLSLYWLQDTKGTQWSLILEKIILKIFSKEGFLVDAHQRPFYSSSLPSHARLILITQKYSVGPETWRRIQSNLNSLQCNSKASAIIYIGGKFNALPEEFADRIVAHSPFDSFMYCFSDAFPQSFKYSLGVFASTIDVERNTIKYSSTWEDISYIQNEVEFLTRNPRQSNVELLRELCGTKENDFLLHKNEQVKVKVEDLEGKVVLLFREFSSEMVSKLRVSALKDVYQKLQRNSEYQAEVVWIPRVRKQDNPEEYERAATSAPWPSVPKPWLINEGASIACFGYGYGKGVVVVDEKGSVSHKDAMPMILRWGIKAYPFSASREEELIKTEWKEFNTSSKSSIQFIFQNLELFQSRATEAFLRGEMIFVCVGSINKMKKFLPKLNYALTKLEKVIQVFYVGDNATDYFTEETEYEMKRKEMSSVTSVSWCDEYKFWDRYSYLCHELCNILGPCQIFGERIVQVKRMIFAFVHGRSVSAWEGRISIIAVDENGEMINGRGEETVEVMSQSDKEEHHKLMSEIKSEGFSHVLRRKEAERKEAERQEAERREAERQEAVRQYISSQSPSRSSTS